MDPASLLALLLYTSQIGASADSVTSKIEEVTGCVVSTNETWLHAVGGVGRSRGCSLVWRVADVQVCRLKVHFRSLDLHKGSTFTIAGVPFTGKKKGSALLPLSSPNVDAHLIGEANELDVLLQQEKCLSSWNGTGFGCGATIRDAEFRIDTQEAIESTCNYTVVRNSSSVCRLQLVFDSFSVEDSSGCRKEYLEVDGLGRLCGKVEGVRSFPFRGPTLTLMLRSVNASSILVEQTTCPVGPTHLGLKSAPPSSAFFRPYPVQAPVSCCPRLYTERVFRIANPGFPGQTGPLDCVFRVRRAGPGVCRLRITFEYFWLGEGIPFFGCRGGHMEVDGYYWCGCQTGLLWTTSTQVFESDLAEIRLVGGGGWGGRRGVVLTVEQSEDCGGPIRRARRSLPWDLGCLLSTLPPPPPPCAAPDPFPSPYCPTLQGPRGSLASPGYPRPYPPYTRQCFRFGWECGTELHFEDFQLGDSQDCSREFLRLPGDPRKYCGRSLLQSTRVVRGGGEVVLSGGEGGGRGYLARYRELPCGGDDDDDGDEGCRRVYSDAAFTIIGPGRDASCSYTVVKQTPDVCGLELRVQNVNLECGSETLMVRGQFYCGRLFSETVQIPFSEEDDVIIKYQRTGDGSGGSFKIDGYQRTQCSGSGDVVRAAREGCETPPPSQARGVLAAPALRPTPPEDIACVYLFSPLPGMCGLRLSFAEFGIPESSGCRLNYLQLKTTKLCGTSLANSSTVLEFPRDGGNLEIPYRLARDVPYASWSIIYEQTPCRYSN